MKRVHFSYFLTFLIFISTVKCQDQKDCTKVFHRKNYDCNYILDMFSITYTQLLKLNPNVDCYNLRFDQPICVDGYTIKDPFCQMKYIAKTRDTCNTIVIYLGIGLQRLSKCNPGINCGAIYFSTGQIIYY